MITSGSQVRTQNFNQDEMNGLTGTVVRSRELCGHAGYDVRMSDETRPGHTEWYSVTEVRLTETHGACDNPPGEHKFCCD